MRATAETAEVTHQKRDKSDKKTLILRLLLLMLSGAFVLPSWGTVSKTRFLFYLAGKALGERGVGLLRGMKYLHACGWNSCESAGPGLGVQRAE